MADTLTTLADVVKVNGVGLRDLGATDVFNASPLLAALAATTATEGTVHSYIKEASAPVVGFRAANTGLDITASTDTKVTLNLNYLDARVTMDKQLADTGKGKDYHLSRQAIRNLRQGLFVVEQQIINGGSANGTAFDGFAQNLNALANAMVVNASGSTARSSVYAIRSVPDETDVVAVFGNEGEIKISPDFQTIVEDATGKRFVAYVMPVDGWVGLQVGGAKSIARLANIPASGTGSVTDALLQQLYDLFPVGAPPTHFVMNRRSRGQLQNSRSTVNVGGNSKLITKHAEVPKDWEGIPIIVTDAIGNAETAVA